MSDRIQNIFNGLLGMFTQDPSRVPIIDKGTYPNVPNVVSTVVPRDLTRVERLNTRIPPPIDISPPPLPTPTVPRDVERDAMEQTILNRANQPSGVMPLSTGVTATPMSTNSQNGILGGVDLMANTQGVQLTRPLHDYTDFDMLTPKGQQAYGGESFGRNMPTTPSVPINLNDVPTEYVPFEKSEQGLLDKNEKSLKGFGDYLMSEKGMLTAAMAFNNLTYDNPNAQNISTFLSDRIKTIDSMKGNLNTAQALETYKSKLDDPQDIAKMNLFIEQLKNNQISSSDALKSVFKSGGININTSDKEKGLWEAVNKDLVERKQSWSESGRSSRELLDQYTRMHTLLDQYGEQNLTEGTLQQLRETFGGIPLFNQLIDQQKAQTGLQFQAVVNQLVLAELRKNKGPQTDFDAIFAATTLPSIKNSTEANRQLITYAQSVNTRNLLIADLVGKARYTKPEQATEIMALADELERNAPGVMLHKNKTATHFVDWAATQEGTGLEKLVRWANVYRKQRLNLGEINVDVLEGL